MNLFDEHTGTKRVYAVLCNLGLAKVEKAGQVDQELEGTVLQNRADNKSKSRRYDRVLMLVDKKSKEDRDEAYTKQYENMRKSCRNIPALTVKVTRDISTYDILHADYLLFQESALEKFAGTFVQN